MTEETWDELPQTDTERAKVRVKNGIMELLVRTQHLSMVEYQARMLAEYIFGPGAEDVLAAFGGQIFRERVEEAYELGRRHGTLFAGDADLLTRAQAATAGLCEDDLIEYTAEDLRELRDEETNDG